MKSVGSVLKSVLADWLINLSVFWFGVVIVSPLFPGINPTFKIATLTADIYAGIISLYFAYRLRKEIS